MCPDENYQHWNHSHEWSLLVLTKVVSIQIRFQLLISLDFWLYKCQHTCSQAPHHCFILCWSQKVLRSLVFVWTNVFPSARVRKGCWWGFNSQNSCPPQQPVSVDILSLDFSSVLIMSVNCVFLYIFHLFAYVNATTTGDLSVSLFYEFGQGYFNV